MTHEEILSMLGDYVDYLIANSSAEAPMWNIEKVRSGKPNKWNYIDGCMITACLSLYKTTGDEKYLKFSKDFIDWFVQEDGSIKTYDPKEYNLGVFLFHRHHRRKTRGYTDIQFMFRGFSHCLFRFTHTQKKIVGDRESFFSRKF